jgi:hypothetical protein
MIQNKIVVHYQDGRLIKGFTSDFLPNKELFHLVPTDTAPGTKPHDIRIPELKAIFFVKDFKGNSDYNEKKEFNPAKPAAGRKIKVLFKDGEIMLGTTQGYEPNRPGFFLIPADQQANVQRCFIIASATQKVALI